MLSLWGGPRCLLCARTAPLLSCTALPTAPLPALLSPSVQTKGLKSGSTVVVCTCTAIASLLAGVLAGVAALGEALPSSSGGRWVRVGSWAAILLGVSSLAGGGIGLPVALLGEGVAWVGGGGASACLSRATQRAPPTPDPTLPRPSAPTAVHLGSCLPTWALRLLPQAWRGSLQRKLKVVAAQEERAHHHHHVGGGAVGGAGGASSYLAEGLLGGGNRGRGAVERTPLLPT